MQTINLAQAATFLHMHPEEVHRRAKRGLLPGAKPGKSWIFIDDDLADYVRGHYAFERQALQVTPRKDQSCHSINAKIRGGSISPHHQESGLDALLKQKIKPKRENCTTDLKQKAGESKSSESGPSTPGTMQGLQWLNETGHKRTHQDDIKKLAWLQQFLRGRMLVDITRDEIIAIGECKRAEASAPTANRYLALIRSVLRKATLEWE